MEWNLAARSQTPSADRISQQQIRYRCYAKRRLQSAACNFTILRAKLQDLPDFKEASIRFRDLPRHFFPGELPLKRVHTRGLAELNGALGGNYKVIKPFHEWVRSWHLSKSWILIWSFNTQTSCFFVEIISLPSLTEKCILPFFL
jgi:hypothetical protein